MWESPPNKPELSEAGVHVWKASSAVPTDTIGRYVKTLAQDERDRAARFHFEKGRDNYIASRGILRELLGDYLSIAPGEVRLVYTSHGKPELDVAHAADMKFNLAHSGGLVMYAFARTARVGIDVERCRPDFDGQRIADRFFTDVESSRLRAVRDSERAREFTRQWTRKESFIKAHGEGLSYPLDTFAILENDDGALQLDAKVNAIKNWYVCDLDCGDEYAAAISVELATPIIQTFACGP